MRREPTFSPALRESLDARAIVDSTAANVTMNADILAALFVTVALAGYVNLRVLRLPPTIGLMVVALAISLVLSLVGHFGGVELAKTSEVLDKIDFPEVLLHGMLAYLLFAGALHVDLAELRSEALPVAALATAGVLVTTAVAGTLFWGLAHLLGFELPYLYALVFGALIAPTDPIAVLAIMKQASAPRTFQVHITGESLFNDGVGVALFLAVLQIAQSEGEVQLAHTLGFFVWEALGAVALGLFVGWAVYKLLRGVDDYPVEVMLTLALAGGVYALAEIIAVSAPIAVVVAGVVIGNHGRANAMSNRTRENLDTFWELVDEILNGILFVLIGLEVLVLHLGRVDAHTLVLAAGAIAVVLLSRSAGVFVSAFTLKQVLPRWRLAAATWAGLRGGISIALALSLPASPYRELIVVSTYAVVLFSIVVQGLTLGPLLKWLFRNELDDVPARSR